MYRFNLNLLLFFVTTIVIGIGFKAEAGIDQGGCIQPQSFYNMKHNYRLQHKSFWTMDPSSTPDHIKINPIITYHDMGYFTLTPKNDVKKGNSEMICKQHFFEDSKVFLTWIGKDCAHMYFMRQFEKLKDSVMYLPFTK